MEFVGSYTDPRYVGLIMLPIAEMDLSKYLAQANATQHDERRTFFGCLARALEFLHDQMIRLKDIKPSDILVHAGNVLIIDFGLSLDFGDADGSTTVGTVNGMTRKYCAPEVAREESRNTASDIWSLGVVFLEMVAVLKGKPIEYIKDFFETHGTGGDCVRTNQVAFVELLAQLKGMTDESDNRVLGWLISMLLEQQQHRPTASELVRSIVAPNRQADGGRYCGICCVA